MEPILVVHESLLMLGDDKPFRVLAAERAVISPMIASKIPGLRSAGIRHKGVFKDALSYRFSESTENLTQADCVSGLTTGTGSEVWTAYVCNGMATLTHSPSSQIRYHVLHSSRIGMYPEPHRFRVKRTILRSTH